MKAIFGVVLIAILVPMFENHDEQATLYVGGIEIEGSEAQSGLLFDLRVKYEEEFEELERTIEDAEFELKKKKSEHQSEILKILNSKQIQKLEAARLEEATNQLKARLEADNQYRQAMGSLLTLIGEAETVELYEGLKRTGMKAYVMPKPGEETFELMSYTFYQEKLAIDPQQTLLFQDLCSDYRSFAGYRGAKFCGGFHPDALLRFSGPAGQMDVLVCFGCHEVIASAGEDRFILEIEAPAYQRFREALLPLLPRHIKNSFF